MNIHEIAEGLIGHFGPDALSEKQFQLLSFIAAGGHPSGAGHIYSDEANARTAFRKIKQAAADTGFAPEFGISEQLPEGQHVKGLSKLTKTIHGENIWIKTDTRKEAYADRIVEAIEAREGKQIVIPPPNPKSLDGHDIIPWLNIGDAHIGMLSHQDETGANFDIKIANISGYRCIKPADAAKHRLFPLRLRLAIQ